MSVLSTHHTPKLNFLLVLKQELTLDKNTHTQHHATNTKTMVLMLKNNGSIWTNSHTQCFARCSMKELKDDNLFGFVLSFLILVSIFEMLVLNA